MPGNEDGRGSRRARVHRATRKPRAPSSSLVAQTSISCRIREREACARVRGCLTSRACTRRPPARRSGAAGAPGRGGALPAVPLASGRPRGEPRGPAAAAFGKPNLSFCLAFDHGSTFRVEYKRGTSGEQSPSRYSRAVTSGVRAQSGRSEVRGERAGAEPRSHTHDLTTPL